MRGSIKKYFLFVLALSFIAGFWSMALAQPKRGGKLVITFQ
jgi:cbb3-type cytochrome oxidase subunit 3